MQATLLATIEELTLHVIAADSANKRLSDENHGLEDRLQQLLKEMDEKIMNLESRLEKK